MYKDRAKQREVTRDRVRRYREGVTAPIIPTHPDGTRIYTIPPKTELKFSKSRQAKGRLSESV